MKANGVIDFNVALIKLKPILLEWNVKVEPLLISKQEHESLTVNVHKEYPCGLPDEAFCLIFLAWRELAWSWRC